MGPSRETRAVVNSVGGGLNVELPPPPPFAPPVDARVPPVGAGVGGVSQASQEPELVEKLGLGELPKNEYPCMNDPNPGSASIIHEAPVAHSKRSRRTPSWARSSDDGYSSDSVLRRASSDLQKMGKRIFVFIAGGATRSELRACHKLTGKLQREVVLGSTSIDDPAQFITVMIINNP
ncbi:hypothetical protein V6N11_081914 [Hibiscus sabdariffa]|uniref:Uncharacterized protein n=1 Tax=Hibiscus sabdariffa TaxID=183260 RepID=A0ABR2Q7K5_9ROSI